MNFRIFLQNSALASFCFSLSPSLIEFKLLAQKVTFGIISDPHQGIMHNGYSRLDSFTHEVKKQNAGFIFQMVDFPVPKSENSSVLLLKWVGSSPKELGYHIEAKRIHLTR